MDPNSWTSLSLPCGIPIQQTIRDWCSQCSGPLEACKLKIFCSFRRFPSRPKPMFQSEAKCEAIDMTMVFFIKREWATFSLVFHSYTNKTHFHKKGSTVSLVLKVRVFVTRKWPIRHWYLSLNTPCLSPPPPPPILHNPFFSLLLGRCASGKINTPFRLTLFLVPWCLMKLMSRS